MKHEEEIQKFPLQTPYYDMAAPEPSPYSDKLVRTEGGSGAAATSPQPHLVHRTSHPKRERSPPSTAQDYPVLEESSLHALISAVHKSQSCAFMGHPSVKRPAHPKFCTCEPPTPPWPLLTSFKEPLLEFAAAGSSSESFTKQLSAGQSVPAFDSHLTTSSLNSFFVVFLVCGFVQPQMGRC